MVWHTRCSDVACYYRCQRPGCLEPDVHFLTRTDGAVRRHAYDCLIPLSAARQAVSELHAGMDPDEIQIARRVLAEALDKLEALEKPRPSIYRESA